MKKIITAVAVAAFGVSAFAQEVAQENDFAVSAKFDFESRYVKEGKRYVNENMQTTISFKYFAPSTSSDLVFTPYADFFWMSPTSNERKGMPISDEGSFTLGSEIAVGETLMLDFGYKYTGWNDRISGIGMNRAYINRTNEIYFGLTKTLSLSDSDPEWDLQGSAYIRYDWNREQLSYELGLKKAFDLEGATLALGAVYGYIDCNKVWGDQRGAIGVPGYATITLPKGGNDYGYFAVTADLSYPINEGTDVGIGVRYAYNNDDDDQAYNWDNNSSNLWWGAWINFRY